MRFSEKLRLVMRQLDINQVQVASMTGCSKGSVSMYLNGKNEPGGQKKRGIAVALGLAPDYFEADTPEPKAAVDPSDKTGIHRVTVKELARILGVDKETACRIAANRELPGLYGCQGTGGKNIYIINEAVFCKC